ncbi:MAG: glycine/sarcosine/betaine reductase selenoprotein B family protein [Gaiellaceae bacterium]
MTPGSRYRGFARVEREYVRRRVYPGFEWAVFDGPSPRHRLDVPLEQARIALVASAGAHLREHPPFALGRDGDASYREIPAGSEEVELTHSGYDVGRAARDPDVVFPLALLRELASEGLIGELAPRAFSFMGYIPDTAPLLSETGPAVARELVADAADLVLLVPS